MAKLNPKIDASLLRLLQNPDLREDWHETEAKVLSCDYHYAKWTNSGTEDYSDDSYFVTTFSYYVDDKLFFGTIEGDMEREEGDTFQVAFDPKNPEHNSFDKPKQTLLARMITWLVAALLLVIVIYLSDRMGCERLNP